MGLQLIHNIGWFNSMIEYVYVSLQCYGINLHINSSFSDFPWDLTGCLARKDSYRIHNES